MAVTDSEGNVIGDVVKDSMTELSAVALALDVVAGNGVLVVSAYRADTLSRRAGNADLFLYAAVNFGDEVLVVVGAYHIGACFQVLVGLAVFGSARSVGDELRVEDTGVLI